MATTNCTTLSKEHHVKAEVKGQWQNWLLSGGPKMMCNLINRKHNQHAEKGLKNKLCLAQCVLYNALR
jgi:hypothetical protein